MSTSSSSPNPSYHTTRTLSTSPHISKLTQSTSGAIKNHSGVKTCRVAEIPRTTTPTARGNTKIGPALEVKITKHFGRRAIEIKIDSTQKDGTLSWMVIGRCVTELSEENKKPIHYEEASSSTGQLVAMEQREQRIPSLSSSPTIPAKQRKWEDIQSGTKLLHAGFFRFRNTFCNSGCHQLPPKSPQELISLVIPFF